jgi:hypothetical protein
LLVTLEKGDSLIGDILLTKRAALLSPHLAAIANDGRRGLDERIAAAESAMVMSVALSQPHRRGANPAAECLSEPLGRFCLNHKPKPLGEHCWHAGKRYAEIVGEAKTAHGFAVPGWEPGAGGYAARTEAELSAEKELALMRLRAADAILVRVMPRLPRIMERFVFDQLDPSPYDEGVIVNGLVNLAAEWGMAPRKFA